MIDFVVDTDVVSYQYRRVPDFERYRTYFEDTQAILSFMTYAELLSWGKENAWGERRMRELREHINSNFVIFRASNALCELWSDVRRERKEKGREIATSDAWIAATAIFLNIPLITNNRRDFELIDRLQLITHAPK